MSHQVSQLGDPRGVALLALTLSVAVPGGLAVAAEPAPSAAPAAGGPSARAERKVKLDFVGADVAVVTKALSIQSGENIVLMPSVSGKVTVRLTDMTLDEALKKVAAAVGADVRKSDGSYFLGSTVELRAMMNRNGVKATYAPKHVPAGDVKDLIQASFPYLTVETIGKTNMLVMSGVRDDVAAALAKAQDCDIAPPPPPVKPAEPAPPPVMGKDVVPLKFAKADDLAATLGKVVPELRIQHQDKMLLLEGTLPQLAQARNLITSLDIQGSSPRTVRAYKLKYAHAVQAQKTLQSLFPNLAIQPGLEVAAPTKAKLDTISQDAQKALSTSSSSTSTEDATDSLATLNKEPGAKSRTLILAGPQDEVDQATQILTSLDVAPQQILIEARLVETSPENTKDLGFLYEWSDFTLFESDRGGRKPWQFGPWKRAPFDFNVQLKAMETQRLAKVLAKPNIAVIDGEEASVFIGDILRYERLSSVTDNGQQIFTIENIPVGVALLCRPRVNDDGNIMLRVHPVVSTVSRFVGRRADIPVTTTREASSTIIMRDGETVAIGGLIRDEDIKTLTKIPFLGDLPVLGQLFRHRLNTRNKSEVTVFITARILKPGA
jgi:type II secretory pathway component GspD/PulD (secretin)